MSDAVTVSIDIAVRDPQMLAILCVLVVLLTAARLIRFLAGRQ